MINYTAAYKTPPQDLMVQRYIGVSLFLSLEQIQTF